MAVSIYGCVNHFSGRSFAGEDISNYISQNRICLYKISITANRVTYQNSWRKTALYRHFMWLMEQSGIDPMFMYIF